LIHAATLVIVGILKVSLFCNLIYFWFNIKICLLYWMFGIIFMITICILALFDGKRLVAFSTIYQVGCSMFLVLFVDILYGLLYLSFHMFYKAILFMILGIIIHYYCNIQDYRFFMFNIYSMIMLYVLFLCIIFCASSLWFLFGYYVKELCLDFLLRKNIVFVVNFCWFFLVWLLLVLCIICIWVWLSVVWIIDLIWF